MYIKNKKIAENKSLLEFLENYFNEGCPATYNSADCFDHEENCLSGKRRSMSDLLDIYKTYNKSEETLEDVIRCLPKLNCTYAAERNEIPEKEEYIIHMRYCAVPQKIVVFIYQGRLFTGYKVDGKTISILDDKDYGETFTTLKGLDGLSTNYVKEVLGI